MPNEIDYTPETKNKLEIDKLQAEVSELRSSVRRWVGSLGGFFGIVTAAVSIYLATDQIRQSKSATKQREDELTVKETDINRKTAELKLAEAVKKENETIKSIGEKNTELATKIREFAALTKQAEEMEAKIAEQKKEYGNIQAQMGEGAAKLATAELAMKEANDEIARLKAEAGRLGDETAKLAATLKSQPRAQKEAATAMALVDSSRKLVASERTALVEDNTKPSLFFFVVEQAQKEKAWEMEEPLKAAGYYIGNVLVVGGKREETPVLRYFRDQDKEEAEKLGTKLIDLGIPKVRVSRVNDPDSAGTGRKYQLWVRKENLANPSGGTSAQSPTVASGNVTEFTVRQYRVKRVRQLAQGRSLMIHVGDIHRTSPMKVVLFVTSQTWDEAERIKIEDLATRVPAGNGRAEANLRENVSSTVVVGGQSYKVTLKQTHWNAGLADSAELTIE